MQPPSVAELSPCPFCKEPIQRGALKCRYCLEMLPAEAPLVADPVVVPPPPAVAAPVPSRPPVSKSTIPAPVKVVAAVGLVLAVVLGGTWFRAHSALKDYGTRFESESAPITAWERRVADGGRPLGVVFYDDVSRFAESERRARPVRAEILAKARSGEGMWFWLSASRIHAAGEMEATANRQEVLATAAEVAAKASAGAAEKVAALRAQSQQRLGSAVAVLNVSADTPDFQREMAALGETTGVLSGRTPGLSTPARTKLEPLAQQLRASIHAGFKQQLNEEMGQLRSRSASLAQAIDRLVAYKSRARAIIDGSDNLMTVLGLGTRVLRPATELAFHKSRPVREFLEEADRPIAGNAGSLLSGFLGAGSTGPVSALSIVTGVDPRARVLVAGVREVLEVIETGHREVEGLSNMTGNLLPKVEAFVGDGSRASLLQFAGAAPGTVRYFDSKKGLFNPAIEKMERLRPSIAIGEQIAARVPLPVARDLLMGIVGGTTALLDLAEKPFREGNRIIDTTAAAFQEVETLEREYAGALQMLRDARDLPAAKAGGEVVAGGCDSAPPVTGDLDGDGVEEQAVIEHCSTGGTALNSHVFVFARRDGARVEIARLEGGDRAFGGIRSVRIASGRLIVDQNRSSDSAPFCCPDYAEITPYSLQGGKLVAAGPPERRKLEESVSQ